MDFSLRGWVEQAGRRLEQEEIEAILEQDPAGVSAFGGEFFLEWNGCRARDHFGIVPGGCPAGEIHLCRQASGKGEPSLSFDGP